MIYYYQIKNKPLTQKMLLGKTCPVCNKKDTLQLTLNTKYVSIIVPVFGMGRTTSVHCTECQHIVKSETGPVYAKKSYTKKINNEINNIDTTYKSSIWQLLYPWTGILLFAGLIITGLAMTRIKEYRNSKIQEILDKPQSGDIYKSDWYENGMRFSKGTLVKVLRIKGDTLTIVRSLHIIEGAAVFSKENWEKIPTDRASFSSKEHKIKLSRFLKDLEFEEFSTYTTHFLGRVMGSGDSNYEFDVVERK
ncbi:hypothetical protein [Flavobacterium johnsoniae]|uniref:Zinc-ribbon 15 domain-containing protein n=1 Tax=Flavobacterium johnsoniae (strain ATCC 17061 / DSM 2064 / JCM 8514 / BCRC 14874 / CCUG 350202 / NBRC 14942 / NCIMB 11054 / UW101) TaxID=376686 RepID=A5FMA8_FLAJ1|nr:hypothetical protein [Flavobacterium johnsoniae]ABQ03665.1 hypothetical protein Fjoh_0630 [Flavobacterium johnsoniae UW101]OXE95162.1 hypothetical protein B0A63_25305 [Flavobacterium johnsoniae UW101]WQG79473.1 hypothetical protein SR927_15730 [Flavobacterium johnsoniae UW101]SHJ99225.1 hypothetical protein SAMN05444146_0027 [Flavobacterium johnsoniae]